MEALPVFANYRSPGASSILRKQVSKFFHGTSILRSSPSKPPSVERSSNRHFRSRDSRQLRPIHVPYYRHWPNATVHRSPTSTRSIIESQSSPPSNSSPIFQMSWPNPSPSTAVTRPPGPQRKWSSKLSIPKFRMPTRSFMNKGFRTKMKNKTVKKKAMICLASGVILAILLIIFLALTVSGTVAAQEFRVVILLFVLAFTVVFAHSMVRLCVVALRPERRNGISEYPEFTPVGGYALPSRPIPVVLARDEEIGISGTEVLGEEGVEKEVLPPPTYGLWRGSVRVDPKLIYWQRVESPVPLELLNGHGHAQRPPSYASENNLELVSPLSERSDMGTPLAHDVRNERPSHGF